MFAKSTWRIITIGDGDLSFSQALTRKWPGSHICATVLDSEQQVREKYQQNAIDELKASGHDVQFDIDITDATTFQHRLHKQFDLAIFQFPLVPNAGARKPGKSWHQGEDSNLANRKLLRDFLLNSADFLLSPEGARLCYITSKDVKPYCDWHIESLGNNGPLNYLGHMQFLPGDFPGYRVRNVDRDKQVKSTAALTYVWSDKTQLELGAKLTKPPEPQDRYCRLCGVGPAMADADWQGHLNSRLHRRKVSYEQNWQAYLGQSK